MAFAFAKAILRTSCMSGSQIRFGSNLKRAVIEEPSKPLQIVNVEQSELKENQVRVEVSYCSVNSVDVRHFQDEAKKLPFVPGYELSGEVIEVGKNIKNEQIMKGEKVAGLSLSNYGGFANQCVLDIDDVWRLPSNVSLKDAAVLLCGHSTALLAFSKFAKISKDNEILVTAGPAGLGLAAVDIAANVYKAKVTGVADTEERGELLRKKGAFQTLHFGPKIKKDSLKATGKKGFDMVYDAVGEHMLETIGDCVAYGGHVFHAAQFDYKTIPVHMPNVTITVLSLQALKEQDRETYTNIVNQVLELADQGIISGREIISKTFQLNEINEAIAYAQQANTTGKILIEIDD